MSINWSKYLKRIVLTVAIALAFASPISQTTVKAPVAQPQNVNWNS